MAFPRLHVVLLFALAISFAAPRVPAQELREEATPYTAWLDFNRLAATDWPRAGLPAWIESITGEAITVENQAAATTVRIRLRELPSLNKEVQLRLFFDDKPGATPKVTGRSDTGYLRFERGPFGQGLGLPTSETMTFPTIGVDFVEIRVPGDGTNLRGAFLAVLKTQEIRRALDFAPPPDFADPFGQSAAPKLPGEDLELYGRVRAALDRGTVKLTPAEAPTCVWEFELQSVPLLALVTFQVLDADGEAPPGLMVNDRPLGAVSVQWPDLADPGYVGLVRPLETGMRFRYSGWLRVQKMIPGSALQVGINRLVLQLHSDSGPVAIRTLELQLKHNWKNLDYTLAPSSP